MVIDDIKDNGLWVKNSWYYDQLGVVVDMYDSWSLAQGTSCYE